MVYAWFSLLVRQYNVDDDVWSRAGHLETSKGFSLRLWNARKLLIYKL